MNKDMVRRMISSLSDDQKDNLGDMLMGLTLKMISEAEDSIEDGREREVFELGKQIGVLEFLAEEYDSL